VSAPLAVNGQAHTRIAIDGTDSAGFYLTDSSAEAITIRNAGGNLEFYPVASHEVVFNESSVDADFRVESDSSTHKLFVDAGNNTVNIGSTTDLGGTLNVLFTGSGENGVAIQTATASNGSKFLSFLNSGGTEIGYVEENTNTSVNYSTSSDQRLKENIADADDAGSKVDAIQVRKFDWIADGSHQDYGMVAQELQSVAPEAVSGDADSEDMMGVDYSKLVPMLVKEIQSLRNRVAELEGE